MAASTVLNQYCTIVGDKFACALFTEFNGEFDRLTVLSTLHEFPYLTLMDSFVYTLHKKVV